MTNKQEDKNVINTPYDDVFRRLTDWMITLQMQETALRWTRCCESKIVPITSNARATMTPPWRFA